MSLQKPSVFGQESSACNTKGFIRLYKAFLRLCMALSICFRAFFLLWIVIKGLQGALSSLPGKQESARAPSGRFIWVLFRNLYCSDHTPHRSICHLSDRPAGAEADIAVAVAGESSDHGFQR